MPAPTEHQRYHYVAQCLHWVMSALILGMLALGWGMTADSLLDDHAKTVARQIHISLGLVILALGLVRLIWRVFNSPPPLPQAMPKVERLAAWTTHLLLYILMIAMPLIGWMMISTLKHPGQFFGLYTIPNLPVISV